MIKIYRIILIGTTLFFSMGFTWIIGGFALSVEPETYKDTDTFIYFFIGMILITPLWIIALLPKSNVKTIQFFRFSGIVQLIFLIPILTNSLIHQLNAISSGKTLTNFSFVIISLCTISLYILIFKIKPLSIFKSYQSCSISCLNPV